MEIRKICVIGAGTMGHGIAQVCAQSGFQVALYDIEDKFLQTSLERIQKALKGSLERGKIKEKDVADTLSRINTNTDLTEAVKDIDLVIEAIIENLEIKANAFRRLDEICSERVIFATNTSYQSVTRMAASTKRPDKFAGMHWFNPTQIMRGIEVIKAEKTSAETIETIVDLARKLGKEPAVVKDSPGFIANRLLQAWRNESFRLYDENIATFQDIDKAFKTAYGFRMGPFELGDLAGLEIALAGSEIMYQETGREIFRPARCVIMKVRAGDLGRKTGRGFYESK